MAEGNSGGEVMVEKVKSGQITDPGRLFNNLSVHISDKYMQVGIELGLDDKVLRDELETGILKIDQGSKKALKMLQLWRDSVGEDNLTYSVLAAALEKQGFQHCAKIYCYTVADEPLSVLSGREREIVAPEQSHQDTTYVFAATPTTAPSSGHSNYELTFPCLDLKKMNKEEKQQLHQRLYAESVEMIDKFQDLFSDTTQSLKQRKVTVKELLCNLVGLGPLPPAYNDLNLPVFRRHLSQLTKSKTIDEAMFEIGHYCSFFNFRMIEHIVNKLGTRQDRKNLEKYRKEFDKYAERHVFECPAEVGTVSKGLANMFVTLDETFNSCTVRGLDLFVENLRKTLKISTGAVFKLTHITPGSLKLTFQLPYSLLQDIFPLSSEQEAALNGMGVVNLWLIYQFNSTKVVHKEAIEGDSVAVAINQKVDKDEYTASIADSALGTASVSGATFTKTHSSVLSLSLVLSLCPSHKWIDNILNMILKHDTAKPRPPDDSSLLKLHQASRREDLDEVKQLESRRAVGEVMAKKVVKSGQITDPYRLFNELSVHISEKYIEIGIELGLAGKVLINELETGKFTMQQGSKNALKMLQLWRESVGEDKCTYSVLAAALEKHGFQRCAHQYCYTEAAGDLVTMTPTMKLDEDNEAVATSATGKIMEHDAAKPRPLDDSSRLKLLQASLRGDLDEVKRLVEEKKLNPSEKVGMGWTPLHAAAAKNHLQVVDYLIAKQQVDPECQDENGYTPLHLACAFGDVKMISYLVNEMSKRTPLNDVLYHRGKDGNTPLHLAALGGNLKVVQLFISKYNMDPNTPGGFGRLPLHDAAHAGSLDTVKYLIEEQNTDLSCRDENEATPLHLAAAFGRLDIVKYLTLDKHCNPLDKDSIGNTPLHESTARGHLDVLDFFVSQLNIDPNTPGQLGSTPLHVAAKGGFLDIIKYLIEKKGCNPSCVNAEAQKTTPLHVASGVGHLHIVAYLIKQQHCNPLCCDEVLGTPLHYAAFSDQLFIVKYFVEDLKCPQNIRGPRNTTPLEDARAQGHTNVVKYLTSIM